MFVKSIAYLLALTLPCCGYGQAAPPAASNGTQQQAHASFEVATIKPVAKCTSSPAVSVTPSGRWSVGCQPLVVLVRLAYLPRLQEGSVSGGPKWAESDLYDVVGQLGAADGHGWNAMSYREQMEAAKPYLRQLLADRFSLKIHTDTKTTEVYALVQSKSGAKLTEVAHPPPKPTEQETKSTDIPTGGFRIVNNRLIARAVQLPNLLWLFAGRSGYEDAPVVNRTGLDGYYDFEMALPDFKEKPEFERQMKIQLGLEIKRQKAALTDVVIDQAERPTPN